jgi:hypothetical protein
MVPAPSSASPALTTTPKASLDALRTVPRAMRVEHLEANVMFPPDDVRPSERLKAGRGKSDPWRTSRVTKGVNLSSHARRLSAIGTSRRLDGSGRLWGHDYYGDITREMPELLGLLLSACPHNNLGASHSYRLNERQMAPHCQTAGRSVPRRPFTFRSSWPRLKRTPAGSDVKTA